MKTIISLFTLISITGCANVTPAQQANIDRAIAVGLGIATQVAEHQLKTKGLAK